MGYKLLGFAVWKGAKWYVGRRVGPHVRVKALAAGGGVALVAGAVVVAMRRVGGDG